jgi:predicted ArsR family transcriptional regulator
MSEEVNGSSQLAPRRPVRYRDEEFIAAVESLSPTIASEVAHVVGCSRALASQRLDKLVNAGEISHRKAGEINIWYIDPH